VLKTARHTNQATWLLLAAFHSAINLSTKSKNANTQMLTNKKTGNGFGKQVIV
jgi:hypothetical protein